MIKKLKNKTAVFQFARYLLVGSSCFIIDFGLFNILIHAAHAHPLEANMISIFVANVYNFFLTNYFTFRRSGKDKMKKIVRFLIVISFNYLINNTLLYIGLSLTNVNENIL